MATTDIDNDTGTQAGTSEASGAQDGSGSRAEGLRRSAAEAYEAARERAQSAFASTREGASQAGRRAADGIDASPVAALVGGFAVGALVAGLLPRTRRETEVLGTVGGRINEKAREAARAARDAGRDKLDEYGLNREGLGDRISELANNASAALKRSSGTGGGGD